MFYDYVSKKYKLGVFYIHSSNKTIRIYILLIVY